MNWHPINEVEQLEQIKAASFTNPQVIFKHSITCSISRMALDRFERAETPINVDFHYLDLLNFRSISNEIASFFQVHHESPQILLIKDGECIYDESHYGIMMDELKSFL
jgi:bacillithiol system protein YtxJ